MDTIRVRCRSCGKEVESRSGKTATCGCPNMVTVSGVQQINDSFSSGYTSINPNMVTISGDVISATDMSDVIMLSPRREERESHFSRQDIEWQEARKNRKIRKLNFEIR